MIKYVLYIYIYNYPRLRQQPATALGIKDDYNDDVTAVVAESKSIHAFSLHI